MSACDHDPDVFEEGRSGTSLFFVRSSDIPSITIMAVQVLMSRRAILWCGPWVTRSQPQQNGVNATIIGVFRKIRFDD